MNKNNLFKALGGLGLAASAALLSSTQSSHALALTGGDAANQASADAILDIVFVIDTSGSMTDDIAAIGTAARNVVQNLNCPDIDCWVRARFFGIAGTSGAVFNENAMTYVNTANGALTPLTNSTEDNGPIVTDLVNWYAWNNDAVGGQKYYKAIVTIGDEGTENGAPVDVNDYNVALQANQAAIANDVLLFSWVTDDPSAGVPLLFQLMAQGGTNPAAPSNGAHVFGNTGGVMVQQGSGNAGNIETTLESIICEAASGGTLAPDGGAGMVWLGLAGIASFGCMTGVRRKS